MAKRITRKEGGSGFFYWFVGLVMGLIVMAVIFPTLQQLWSPETVCLEPETEVAEIPVDERPQFDFYKILPELEVVVPTDNVATRPTPAQPTNQSEPVASGSQSVNRYVLQVGSFKAFDEADRFKASLALLGVEPTIDQVTVNGTVWHRVQLGPFTSQREIDRIQRRLEDNQIQAIALKLK